MVSYNILIQENIVVLQFQITYYHGFISALMFVDCKLCMIHKTLVKYITKPDTLKLHFFYAGSFLQKFHP